ncbi:reverse transcriptase domain-containing protein [Tanacetum coccineum]|uniref:Reverse transcriptase domain-containing protein n=1 Tax=Tanacetum coccineum TaxID=301880 RepID=A0ABQ4XAY0_9ASTR
MMRVTTAFLRGEVAGSNRERKKLFLSWKQQEANQKQNFKKGAFRNQQRSERKQDRFTLLTKTPTEIFALGKGKFKAPPPMTTPVEKQNRAKFCEFHGEVGHNTDEYMHLKKQIEEMLKAGKLSHLIKELKKNNGKEQPKLLVKVGDEEHSASAWMNFMVVRSPSPYNGIIGRPGFRKLQAVPSTAHGMLKIPVEGGVFTLKSSKLVPLEYAMVSGPEETPSSTKPTIEERVKKRGQAADKNQAIQEEVGKLVEAGIMKKVHYHDWLSNPVMVKKHDDSWRMCVDFKDLNKACLKDGYPLPEIDWKVKSLCGFPLKCFVDAYKGYHHIQMAKEDEEKTAFINNQGIFCYTKMPFGLRNVGETYQRLMDKAFHKQIGRNLEVYVDDLVIKSRTEDEIVRDIEETFKTLREINMKLNPKKCTFRVEEGMFLGYKINTKGLKAKATEKSLPFFKTLKKCTKKSDFHWTTKAEEAFKQMKQLIAELPMLTVPVEKEELIVYLAAAKETVSAVLITEREAKQMPIYFVSRALRGPELNYTLMEKLVLALMHASKRLKRYFQAHPIIVITDQPIQQILSRPAVAGRLQKWSIELGEYAIHYKPRVSVKGKILADFIILFTDGSSCTDGSEAGLILTNPEGVEFTYALRFRFDATNNKAEYEALIDGLRIAEQMGVKNLQANVDSRLVANQLNGTYVAKEADMIRYLEKVKTLIDSFKAFSIKQVLRSENKKADALSKIASTSFAHLSKQVLVEELKENSISKVEILAVVEEEGDTWMIPILKYLAEGTLPMDMKKARAIRHKSWQFVVVNETLYKKSFLGPWLRCVGPLHANYVLREIHEGSCSIHAGTRSVVAKALRTGYYRPTMHKDARTLIRACQDCQVHKTVPRNP